LSAVAERRAASAPRRRDAFALPLGTIVALLAPALAVYFILKAYPVLRTFWNSVHEVTPAGTDFVGLRNYADLLQDDTIWRAVGNTVLWAGVSPIFEVGIALLLAFALHSRVPGARLFRLAWFTPVLMSYVVVGIIWTWIYNYDWGAVNMLLRAVGLGHWARPWLGDPTTALPALILVTTWMWTGFNMVVLLAALHALPSEVLEASELDNCGWLAKIRFVIVPMILPTLVNLLILSFVGKMKIFDLVWVTTRGGPLWATETVSTYTYKRAFEWSTFDLGYPSAIAVVWFVIIIAVVVGLNVLTRPRQKLEY
jgi:multiple sugar transport system permease protein/raffinose/stachyose/melibiose transport system permease protein